MNPGTVVVLNGASSSGKSTLLAALQLALPEPFLAAGLDRFLWMLPARYLDRPLWDDVLGRATHAGSTGHRLVAGMHRAIRALALAGNHVLADHVLVESAWVADCADQLADLPAFLIGVRCPLAVLEARERARQDRTLGQARAQFDRVHAGIAYDLEVDTARHDPEACAQRVLARLHAGAPSALRQLRRRRPDPAPE